MNLFLKRYKIWTGERMLRHVIFWGTWAGFYIALNSLMSMGFSFFQWFAFEMLALPIKIGCSYTIAYFLMPQFLYKKKYVAFFLSSFGVFIIFSILLLFMDREVIYPYVLRHPVYNQFYHDFAHWALQLGYISAFIASIKFFQNLLEEREKSYLLRQEKIQTELKYLKNQVQPHFLFNTLNNLYGMVLSKDENSADSIIKLSDMLSYMLYESEDDFVLLEKELTHLDNYIKLEQIRYNRKLNLCYKYPEVPKNRYIAPHLLIPFVENAFKHGPAKEEGLSTIYIQFSFYKERLNLIVKNTFNGTEMDQNIKSGIGLANVRKRLDLIYPGQYELSIREKEMFEVHLSLILKKEKAITV